MFAYDLGEGALAQLHTWFRGNLLTVVTGIQALRISHSMPRTGFCCVIHFLVVAGACAHDTAIPIVINTWPFTSATDSAWEAIAQSSNTQLAAVNAVEAVSKGLTSS